MIQTIHKNLIDALEDGEVDAIIQGVNCCGKMGSGLAKEIRSRIPKVYDDYLEFCNGRFTYELLGSVCRSGKVFNCFTQEFYGRDGKKYVDDAAIFDSLQAVREMMKELGLDTIGIPYMFCCGLGGGDWVYVMDCIEKVFEDFNVKIYRI